MLSIAPITYAFEDDPVISLNLRELLTIKIKERSKLKLFYDSENKPDEDTINIGILISFSESPKFFADFLMAADLAVKDINNKGGILGKRLVLVRGNSTTDPIIAASIAEQMIKQHDVKIIIGPMYSSMVEKVALNAAVPNGTPLILPSATSSYISEMGDNDLVFRIAPTNQQIVKRAIELMESHKVTKLGIFFQEDSYGREMYDLLNEHASKEGIKIAYKKELKSIVDYESYDFVDELFDAKSHDLDGYFLPISYEQARWNTIRNIIKREKIPVPILYLPEHSQIKAMDFNRNVCAFGIGMQNDKMQEAQLNQTITNYLGSSTWRHYSPSIHDSVYLSALAISYHQKLKIPLNRAIRMVTNSKGQELSYQNFELLPDLIKKEEKLRLLGISGAIEFDSKGDNVSNTLAYSSYHHDFGKGCYLN